MSKEGKGERYRLYCMLNGMAVRAAARRSPPLSLGPEFTPLSACACRAICR